MKLQVRISGLVVFVALLTPTDAMKVYDPQLCYILDGILGLYGIFITGLFLREKFFKTKVKAAEEEIYTDLKNQDSGHYDQLTRDTERGRNRWLTDKNATYTELNQRTEGEYKELPIKRERQRKNEKIYQDLSSVNKDTYNSLQMKPLPAR